MTAQPVSSPSLTRARLALALSDEGSLCDELSRLRLADESPEALKGIADDLIHRIKVLPDNPGIPPHFGNCMREALRAINGGDLPHPQQLRSVGQDFIAQEAGLEDWTPAQMANRLLLEQIPQERSSAAVVGTARDDGIYLLEWVAHYRALGFDHIFLYTNDNSDGSDELMLALAEAGVITLVENEVTGAVPPEVKAYGHALNLMPSLWRHEWALFVDSDEFLHPALSFRHSIAAVLAAINEMRDENDVGAILYDWKWYVSNMAYRRAPGLLSERFTHTRDHWLGKCLVRLRDTVSMRRQHCPDLVENKKLCASDFSPLLPDTVWQRSRACYDGGQINHYWPKSFEEFFIKKARGAALGWSHNPYDRPYRKFFEWNGFAVADRHEPVAPDFLARLHSGLAELRKLPGVAEAHDGVEARFHDRLGRMIEPEQLQRLYLDNRVPPGDL